MRRNKYDKLSTGSSSLEPIIEDSDRTEIIVNRYSLDKDNKLNDLLSSMWVFGAMIFYVSIFAL